ncbi:MAG: DUF1573 domain-containing protein [Bacillota bacterium]|nr:DUF1573 domain-containing protein [Bacillota bacterium]
MKDILFEDFQQVADEMLLRNKSLLDTLSKLQLAGAKLNRTVIKSVTHCGCISIHGRKQNFKEGYSLEEMKKHVNAQVSGELCGNCRELVEKEMGGLMFYLAAVCNTLRLSMYDVLIKERDELLALGKFNLK